QLTKAIVSSQLGLDEAVHVVGPFSIRHVQNSGIAFGLFASATSFVILLTAAAVAWMLYFFARSGSRHPILPVALGLVIGGSVSNLIDRVRLGHVTDFLDFKYWPAFNLADSFLVVGVAILLLALVSDDRKSARPPRMREAARSWRGGGRAARPVSRRARRDRLARARRAAARCGRRARGRLGAAEEPSTDGWGGGRVRAAGAPRDLARRRGDAAS